MNREEIDDIFLKIKIEGNEHHWQYKKKYPCRMLRNHGNWCGYVSVPKGHPCFGLHYDEVEDKYDDLTVHGGLTYSEGLFSMEPDKEIREHEIKEQIEERVNETDYWEFGFDTAHAWDLTFYTREFAEEMLRTGTVTYKDKEYVIKEVNELARQLEEIEGNHNNKK